MSLFPLHVSSLSLSLSLSQSFFHSFCLPPSSLSLAIFLFLSICFCFLSPSLSLSLALWCSSSRIVSGRGWLWRADTRWAVPRKERLRKRIDYWSQPVTACSKVLHTPNPDGFRSFGHPFTTFRQFMVKPPLILVP